MEHVIAQDATRAPALTDLVHVVAAVFLLVDQRDEAGIDAHQLGHAPCAGSLIVAVRQVEAHAGLHDDRGLEHVHAVHRPRQPIVDAGAQAGGARDSGRRVTRVRVSDRGIVVDRQSIRDTTRHGREWVSPRDRRERLRGRIRARGRDQDVIEVHDGGTGIVRIWSDAYVPAGEVVDGEVVAVFGSVTVEGTVTREVVAVMGSVHLKPGARVDARGCPFDRDGDGVCDGLDKCPGTAAGLAVDSDGCSIELVDRETELLDTGMIRLQNINFETGKANILPESHRTLDIVGLVLSRWPELRIEVGGHTDSRGSDAHNQRLSQARADSVLSYLTRKFPALQPAQFSVRGYGEGRPLVPNTSALNWAKNRRVEFVVLNKDVLRREDGRWRMVHHQAAPFARRSVPEGVVPPRDNLN